MRHADLLERGRLEHWRLDNALDASGDGYAVTDVLALESNLGAPATGTSPNRAAWATDFSLWEFPNTANRYLQSAVQLPHTYLNGSDLRWHVHIVNASQLTVGQTVIFKADVITKPVGGSEATATTYTSAYTASGTIAADSHLKTVNVVVPGSALIGSAFVLARIYRDVSDTYNGSVFLLGSDYHIRVCRIGSATENAAT